LFGTLDITTVEGLTAAIETVGVAFLGLSKFAAGVIESFKPLVTYFLELGSGARELDTEFLKTFGKIGGFASQLNFIADATGVLVVALDGLVGVLALKQGASLLSAFTSVGPAASTFASALFGPVGVAVALGAAAIAGTAYVVSQGEVEAAQEKAAEATVTYKEKTDELNTKLAELSEALGLPIKSYEEFEKLLSDGTIVWDDTTDSWARAAESLTDLGDASSKSWEEIDKSNKAMLDASTAGEKAAVAQDKLAAASEAAVDKQRGWKAIIDETTGAIVGYEQIHTTAAESTKKLADGTDKATESAKKIAEAAKEAAKAQMEWNLEMEKLKAAERLALVQAASEITTARIQADAQVMVASFESINSTISSTSDTIGKLGSALAGVTPNTDAFDVLERQLEEENKIRREAFELQKQQVTKQIELIQARIEALQRGDALIQIDGAGLQPHLEAFMWEILSAIQVRVNQDGLELLLGA
jgi:hypothetical protein